MDMVFNASVEPFRSCLYLKTLLQNSTERILATGSEVVLVVVCHFRRKFRLGSRGAILQESWPRCMEMSCLGRFFILIITIAFYAVL